MRVTLTHPENMNITDANGDVFIGGSQRWYTRFWRRMSGCGPVSASNLIWYKTDTPRTKDRYCQLMEKMFTYVTPGSHGVNTSTIFTEGIMRYGADTGLSYTTKVIEIPKTPADRPDAGAVSAFITDALQVDSPLAFLNLSSGSIKSFDSWHWVTITAFDTDTMQAEICDYSKQICADIAEWLETSKLGGAIVSLRW